MNDPGKNEQVANQAKELFDDSVERLDAAALSRLNRGRHQALAELQKTGPFAQWSRWAPATGLVAAAVVIIMVMRGPVVEGPGEAPVTASDFEMLLEEDGFEMFEDLEFYSLLDAVDSEPNGNVG
jgi:hypothetical protein